MWLFHIHNLNGWKRTATPTDGIRYETRHVREVSTVAFSSAIVAYLRNKNTNILLVDTDTDTPDVLKMHKCFPRRTYPAV